MPNRACQSFDLTVSSHDDLVRLLRDRHGTLNPYSWHMNRTVNPSTHCMNAIGKLAREWNVERYHADPRRITDMCTANCQSCRLFEVVNDNRTMLSRAYNSDLDDTVAAC